MTVKGKSFLAGFDWLIISKKNCLFSWLFLLFQQWIFFQLQVMPAKALKINMRMWRKGRFCDLNCALYDLDLVLQPWRETKK